MKNQGKLKNVARFDSRLVHYQSGLNTGFEPLYFLKGTQKGTQNEMIKHMNIQLTKGESARVPNLINSI